MSSDLRPFSYVVLALVGEGGAGAHDIYDMIRRGGPVYWTAAASQVYAEPKRLARLGYLTAAKEPGKTHDRTVYRLTAAGREALTAWLRSPSPFPRIQHEASVRLLAGDMIADAEIVTSLQGLRREIAAVSALVDEMEAARPKLPHRERYLRLEHSLARRLLQAQLDWIEEVEQELGTGTAVRCQSM
jgi:DNA-binding PadR family transcriptional regulator